MGIPKFYGDWLKKSVPSAILDRKEKISNVASLAFDLNGLLYEAKESVYGALNQNKPVTGVSFASSMKTNVISNSEELERIFLNNIQSLMMEAITKFQPQYCLIIAIDGVVPLAKLQQQKQRRAKNAPNKVFDSNGFTPGTEIMMKIDQTIRTFIKLYKDQLPPKVIYSSHLVPGEAEHKIMDMYREGEIFDKYQSDTDKHILFGLDADLIVLSLISPVDNIIVVRKLLDDRVDIEEIKKYLAIFSVGAGGTTASGAAAGVENDFAVMILLVGNDFLPHMPALENIADGINYLLNVYKKVNLPLTAETAAGSVEINWNNLLKFLIKLSEEEVKLLIQRYANSKNKSQLITDSITNKNFNFSKYRNLWYNRALGSRGSVNFMEKILKIVNSVAESGDDGASGVTELKEINEAKITEMINKYLITLSWVFLYYKEGTKAVNSDWLYPYYYTPLLRDLIVVLERNLSDNGENDFNGVNSAKAREGMINFTALHQMVAVLPRHSVKLLPEELRPLFSVNSPILDMYFEKFDIDMDGKEEEHNGIVIIPFIDKNRIYEAVEQMDFDKERAELWKPIDNQSFDSSDEIVYKGKERRKITVGDIYAYRENKNLSHSSQSSASSRGRGMPPSGGRGRGGAPEASTSGRGRGSGAPPSRGVQRGGRGMPSSGGRGMPPTTGRGGGRGGLSNLAKPGNVVKRNDLPEIEF
jgi:5'-3' exonuclease